MLEEGARVGIVLLTSNREVKSMVREDEAGRPMLDDAAVMVPSIGAICLLRKHESDRRGSAVCRVERRSFAILQVLIVSTGC